MLSILGSFSSLRHQGDARLASPIDIKYRDIDSVFDLASWGEVLGKEDRYNYNVEHLGKLIIAETCPDGTIQFHGERYLGSPTISLGSWRRDKSILESALEKAYLNPIRYSWKFVPPPYSPENAGRCLPESSLISTPNGLVSIRDLRIGDYVWTADKFGRRVKTVIVKKAKRTASKNHKMAHVILKDGRELVASLGHPTIDYREIGSLIQGDDLDTSSIISIKVVHYKGKYTYDILPYGETGGYWANDILIGSTLSYRFQKTIADDLHKPLYLSL